MGYILQVSKLNRPKQEVIDRLVRIHQTPQDSVIVTEVEDYLENGFKIGKVDRVTLPKKSEPELKDYLKIKEYKFDTRITAKENDEKIKREQGLIE